MKKNYELDFWKFIFSLVIIVYHSHNFKCAGENPDLLIKGYIGVEFFFMVSGYLMMSGIVRDKQKGIERSTWSFIGKKVKAFMPITIFAFLVNFFVWTIANEKMSFKNILIAFLYTPPELMYIRHTGIRFATHNYNGPGWYISAMLLGMFILYPLAKKYSKKFGLYIAPILSAGLYAWISHYTKNDSFSVIKEWLKGVNGGLVRAVAGLCLGAFIYYVTEKIKSSPRQLNTAGHITVGIAEVFIVFALYLFMRNNVTESYGIANDAIAVLYMFFLLVIIISRNSNMDRILALKPMLFLYKLSLPLFLNQWAVVRFINAVYTDVSFQKQFVLYLALTVALALISLPCTKGFSWLGTTISKKLTTEKEA